jgi:hypothetical protein
MMHEPEKAELSEVARKPDSDRIETTCAAALSLQDIFKTRFSS